MRYNLTTALAARVAALEERIEDLEDLMSLNEAIEENNGKLGTRWEDVREEILS